MLELNALQKNFGDRRAVDGLSLRVRQGECVALLGPNGAGKSTTLGMIAGVVQPDAGQSSWCGAPTHAATTRARIGVAPQALALYERLSARDNLLFFAGLYGLRGKTARDASDRVLAAVQLQDRAGDRVDGFSGGMKRRLNLAVALLHDPDLLLLDEPTAGVDPQSRNQLFETVEALTAAGKTVLYTTHYMEEAERLCSRIAIVDHGRILADAPLADLLRQHGGESELLWQRDGQERRVKSATPQTVLREWLAEADADRAQISVRPPTLENVFLHLTGRQLRD